MGGLGYEQYSVWVKKFTAISPIGFCVLEKKASLS